MCDHTHIEFTYTRAVCAPPRARSGDPPPADLFDRAGDEIYKLMERDTYRRHARRRPSHTVAAARYEPAMGSLHTHVWRVRTEDTHQASDVWRRLASPFLPSCAGLLRALLRWLLEPHAHCGFILGGSRL